MPANGICVLLLIALLFPSDISAQTTEASLVIINARVWTADESNEWASAIAVDNDTILYVGDDVGASEYLTDNTLVFDAGGKLIVPGFIDTHVHFLTGGFRLSSVQLRDADSREEFVKRIADFAGSLESGTWITGGDWDHTLWGGELPDRAWIDSVTPNNPVWINRLDGHMALANTAALEQAGITDTVGDVDGGAIQRDENGRVTGLFRDNAMGLVGRAVPDAPDELNDRALRAAMDYVARQGVTSVHDMSGSSATYQTVKRAHTNGDLRTRIYLAHPVWQWQHVADLQKTEFEGDAWFKIGALKGFVDGSLGSHTAAFFDEYDDTPGDSGFFVNDMDELYEVMKDADAAGLQLMIHAIGDRAISELLDVYERIQSENDERDRRHRIEHAQHIHPDDLGRFGTLGVIASMQPYHAIDDGRWADTYIGKDRAATTYAFRSLLDAGATVVFGSDWFVAPPTPLEGIYAAVTRRTLDDANPNGWVPQQKISVAEALRAYTIDAAYSAYDDGDRGSLESGKLADLVVLDEDIFTIPPHEIRDTAVVMTIVGGQIVYQRRLETRE